MNNVSKSYAKALFEISEKAGLALKHSEELSTCRDIIESLPKGIFMNPLISAGEKHKVIENLLEGKADRTIVNFMKLLCDNKRTESLGDICKAYIKMVREHAGSLEATLYYVVLPADDEIEKIKAWLMKKYNKTDVLLDSVEDRTLLGGIVLVVGDTVYDKSIKKMISAMGNSLKSR